MKRTPFWFWLIRDEITGKLRKTTWRMTEEEAAAYPGAVKVEAGVEYRDLPESDDEMRSMQTNAWQNKPHG